MSLLVLHAGPLSSVQDLGRPGFGAIGVAQSGAMDPWALRTANVLVGNDDASAGIEFTMSGPTIAFEEETVVALTGSRFEVSIIRSACSRNCDASGASTTSGISKANISMFRTWDRAM